MNNREYCHPGYASTFSKEEVRSLDKEEQKEIMKEWFLSNYEDPVNNTPYDGGYVYIWGGPFSTKEILGEEFYGFLSDEIILEVAHELETEEDCREWTGIPSEEDYDEFYFSIFEGTDFYATFRKSLNEIDELIDIEVTGSNEQYLLKLFYANIIAVMETYLFDAIMNNIFKKDDYIKNFIAKNKDFKERKICLSEIFLKMEKLNNEIKDYLLKLSYHNLPKVKNIYKEVFDVDFPEELGKIYKAIDNRHHIVHRNGRRKDGTPIIFSRDDIKGLISEVTTFVESVDVQIREI